MRSLNHHARWLGGLALVLFTAGCATVTEVTPTSTLAELVFSTPLPSLTPPADAEGIVLAWIECEDQCEAQLEALLALGSEATPVLVRTLTEGPPTERAEAMKEHLEQVYKELAEYAETHPEAALELDQGEYVSLYLDNYQAQYQTKAVQALVALGEPEARDAILKTLRTVKRDDVREALEQALEQLGG
jgi:hypothetical protein